MIENVVLNTRKCYGKPRISPLRRGERNNVQLTVSVCRDRRPYDLTGMTAHLVWQAADGKLVGPVPMEVTDADAGMVSCTLPDSCYSAVGTARAYIELRRGAELVDTTDEMFVDVLDCIDADAEQAEEYKPLIGEVRDATNAAKSAAERAESGEDERVAAEGERVSAESARKQAETERTNGWADLKADAEKTVGDAVERADSAADRATQAASSASAAGDAATAAAAKAKADTKAAVDSASASVSKAVADAKADVDAAVQRSDAATAKAEEAVETANTANTAATQAVTDAQAAIAEVKATEAKLYPAAENVLKGTAKDTLVHVDDAFPSSLLGIDIEGASEQFISTGKNLAKLTEDQKTINGLNVDIKANGQIILDGTCSHALWMNIGTVDVVEGKTYCLSLNKAYQTFGVSAWSYSENRHVIFASAKLQEAKGTATKTETLKIFAVGGRNMTFTREVVKIQIEEGSSATHWEPYTDGKPSQDIRVIENPVVKVTGANTSAVRTSLPFTMPAEHPYLAKLPDGTADTIDVDKDGNTTLVAKVGKSTAAVSDGVGGEVGTDAMSSTGAIADGAVVYYKLATPVTYALGEVTVPSLPDSTSNVWTDAEVAPNTSIEYVRDVNIVVANLESAIASITQG